MQTDHTEKNSFRGGFKSVQRVGFAYVGWEKVPEGAAELKARWPKLETENFEN